MRMRPFQQPILVAIICTLFLLVTWPAWQWLWREWLANDYYSHGILLPFVALFLAIRRLQLQRPSQTGNDELLRAQKGVPILLAALWLIGMVGGYLFFLAAKALYLASFTMIGMLGGIVWLLGGQRLLALWLFPIGYLLLMVPLPFIERFTYPLAIFAGLCGGGLVKLLGMDLTIVGNAVTLPNAELIIGAQCSGINSLIALTALMTLAAYLLAGPMWARVGLIIAAMPLAIMGNILRIASLLFVARNYGADAAFTFYHDYSGFVIFIAILLLMVPLTRLLRVQTLRLDVI